MPKKKKAQPTTPRFTATIEIEGYLEIDIIAPNMEEALKEAQSICLGNRIKFINKRDNGDIHQQKVTGIWQEI